MEGRTPIDADPLVRRRLDGVHGDSRAREGPPRRTRTRRGLDGAGGGPRAGREDQPRRPRPRGGPAGGEAGGPPPRPPERGEQPQMI